MLFGTPIFGERQLRSGSGQVLGPRRGERTEEHVARHRSAVKERPNRKPGPPGIEELLHSGQPFEGKNRLGCDLDEFDLFASVFVSQK